MSTNFFCTSSLNTPRGPGHPRNIFGTSGVPPFETQGDKLLREGTNFSTTTPSHGRPPPHLSVPHNRNHKSLAIANRNFAVASFPRRNRSEITVLQGVFGVAVIFWVAIAVASDLRFEVAAIRVTKHPTRRCPDPKSLSFCSYFLPEN